MFSDWCGRTVLYSMRQAFACLLVGQPTLRRRMQLGALAALDQRIGLRYAMPLMTSDETTSYLRHHLALAARSDTLFSDDAIALIHQTSRGYPERSTTSLYRPSSPPSPPTKQSSTRNPPAQPSPRSPPNDHHPRHPDDDSCAAV
jgi:hypothetical protein